MCPLDHHTGLAQTSSAEKAPIYRANVLPTVISQYIPLQYGLCLRYRLVKGLILSNFSLECQCGPLLFNLKLPYICHP